MDSLQFCYFLQGFLEINNNPDQQMSAQQVQIIKDHLDLVFTKVTPNYVPLTSITSYPFYGDKIEDGFPRPREYCGMPPDAWKSGYGNTTWDEENKVWKNSSFEETIQVSC